MEICMEYYFHLYNNDDFEKKSSIKLNSFKPHLFVKPLDFKGNNNENESILDEYTFETCDLQIIALKKEKSSDKGVNCFYCNKKIDEINEKDISQLLRGSNTWCRKDGENCFIGDGGKTLFVFDANKFGVISNEGFGKIYFHWALRLRALAEAYNIKADEFIAETKEAYKSGNVDKMCNIRDEIYEFDLMHYFENPISENSFLCIKIWEYFVKFLRVKEKHNEMKTQISELVNIIEVREKQKQAKIEAKEKEEQAQKDKERDRSLQIKIAIFGVVMAIITLFSEEIKPPIKTCFNQVKDYLFIKFSNK